LTVLELIEILQKYQEEIGGDETSIAAHNLESQVSFHIVDPDIDIGLEIDDSRYPSGIELDLMVGCYCPQGVIFNLKKRDEIS
jgi:hypothetical protein